MSLKDLFQEKKYKHISNVSANSLTSSGVESPGYVEVFHKDRDRFIPLVDYSNPKEFARFGSAEKYYYDSIKRTYETYPYDGSKKEKILWELSSSGLDLYLFENGYPRSTGYAVFTTESVSATATSTDYSVWGSYGAAGTGTYEYISFNGGPHPGQGNSIHVDPDTGEAHYRKGANIYDLSENRECNLKIGGNDGNTVEFWLKKAAFDTDATQTEVLFDIFTTSSISSSAGYGRLTIEMSGHGAGTNTLSPFYVTYMSGTDGVSKQNIGTLTTSSIADDEWHHYSFRFKNEGSNVSVDLFVDGQHNANTTAGTTVDYVSGTIVGTIGALATHPSGTQTVTPQANKGWGKLSGSIDELRFWKNWRTSKEIQTRWFEQVGGGTNTDIANTHLGLYYKFNEGITLTSSVDSIVLDYSGRLSNGTWFGYSSDYSRDTGSAINETSLTSFSGSEFRDPILYSFHPEIVSYMSERRKFGREHDYSNPSTLYYSLPSWILEEHETSNADNEGIVANSLWNLTQIMSSYFDDVANFMKSVPDLAQPTYVSGSEKPIPFMKRILESKGFVAPNIFNAIDALEAYENRDENTIYDVKLDDVKNIIYKNIYNNLNYINKTKGTEKSFRNLIRCFGIDDQIYKLNIYANNADYILEDNFRSVSNKYSVVNFNTVDNSNALVFQYSSSLNPNSTTFISASKDFTPDTSQEGGLPFSVEANVIFPNRVSQADYNTLLHFDSEFRNTYPLMITASLFGMHTADDSSPEDTTWNSNDYANFVVLAEKFETFSNQARFVLTGTAGGFLPELTSSYYKDVYTDSNWSFLVTLYPEKYPNVNQVSGAINSLSDYVVEFRGINNVLDATINEFSVSGTITAEEATKFLASPKRIFAGCHKTNFTGSTLTPTDVRFNTIRAWQNKLTDHDLRLHASDPNNYSIKNPYQNAYLFNDSIKEINVPNKETILLHWNFNNVTSSDASGEFIVDDLTSGSSEQTARYGFLGNLLENQYTGRGFEFSNSSTDVVIIDDIITAKQNLPEVLPSDGTVKVLTSDDIYFTRDSRPTFFDLYIEKSPYQNISEEMLKFMSTVVDFNNLIGHGVDRYRGEYKSLKSLRQLFFERTDTPNVEKYIEYFKWFDLAVSSMIQKLAPMSSGLDDRPLRNIIESHVLERNKYQTKFPTYEFKQSDPEASIFGINEMLYPWKEGHAPISEDESDNCHWFKDRAERDGIPTSDDSDVDSDRQEIIDVINNQSNTTPPNLSGSNGTYQGSTYALRRFPRPYRINAAKQPEIHGGGNAYENKKVGFWDSLRKRPTPDGAGEGGLISIEPPDTDLDMFKDCDDNLELNKGKRKYNFSVGVTQDGIDEFTGVFKGDLVFPFSLYSSSVDSNPAMADLEDFQSNLAITNLHHDSYGPFSDVPMQGPFTEKFVGGRSYRHVMTNFTWDNEQPDSEGERLEGWRLTASADALDLVNPSSPKSVYFREEYAKRPVNIKNIKQLTSSLYDANDQATDAFGVTRIGNYTNTYEIVMTNGRSINNRYLAESDGDLPTETSERDSIFVSGVIDFPLPRRDLTGSNKFVIVNRFSAPGDVTTMTEGMLDIAAAEYSVYNALPYRNLAVRQPLQELLTDHTNQFGFFSDARTVADYERATWANYPGGSSSIDDLDADLDYRGTGSFHKVNRNGRKQPKYSNEYTGDLGTVEIDTAYDNFFVQHQIPQTDVQYAWITASLIENYTGSALYGFEQPDFSNASLASTDLTFITSSDFVGFNPPPNRIFGADGKISGLTNVMPGDFAGLNTLVYEPVSSSTNILGYPAGTSLGDATTTVLQYRNVDVFPATAIQLVAPGAANILLLKRQGPYGGANWKLYRKDNHPIVRTHRGENRLSYLKPERGFNLEGKQVTLSGSKGSINSVIEPPITSKYKQLTHNVIIPYGYDSEVGAPKTILSVDIDHSYMNNIRFFTDHILDGADLDDIILRSKNIKTEQQMLDVINYYLYQATDFNDVPEFNPIRGLNSFTTRETIYPKEKHTYIKSHRQRNDYVNGFWRDNPDTRRERGTQDPVGDPYNAGVSDPYYYGIISDDSAGIPRAFSLSSSVPQGLTASIWSLDAREDFVTNSPGRIKSGSGEGTFTTSFTVLGVPITRTYYRQVSASDGAGILQNALYPYSNNTQRFDILFNRLVTFSTLLPQYNRRIAGVIPEDTTHEFKFGDTKWEAGEQSGLAPFYDTYDDYIEDIKRVGKDHSIVPEFRISNHMDYYLNTLDSDFFGAAPDSVFELTGTSLKSTENTDFYETYSHSDFLRTFSVVKDFYGNDAETSKVTLSVDAMIKFLPYDGFYPADRTVQITKLFYDSYNEAFNADITSPNPLYPPGDEYSVGAVIPGSNAGIMNPVWKTLFAPGVLYNSIKSGIAVDYPVHTGSTDLQVEGTPNQRNGLGYLVDIPRIDNDFDYRIPFEALYDPEPVFHSANEIIDSEPHPSASTPTTASLAGDGKLNYKLAMNNFLGSTVDFFLKNGQMSYLASVSDTDVDYGIQVDDAGAGFQVGKEYRMRIALQNTKAASLVQIEQGDDSDPSFIRNTPNIVMYAQTGSDPNNYSDYYGSAFGPPCNASGSKLTTGSGDANYPLYGSASYEPFTPPYYDGYSYVEMIYKPEFTGIEGENLMFSIVNSSSFEYFREYTSREATRDGYVAAKNAMQISASIDIKVAKDLGKKYDQFGNLIEFDDGANNGYKMIIEPKWESPILDFQDVAVTLPLTGSGSVARGMWHQYGSDTDSSNGIFLQVQDLDNSEIIDKTMTGSLAKRLGFNKGRAPARRKLGQIADFKKVSEAIVAVPFFNTTVGNQQKTYKIPKDVISKIKSVLNNSINLTNEDILEKLPGIDPSIVEMVMKMKKFVIPPHMDFINNTSIDPFAMFIFDFEVTLNKQDLSNIWQNLSPNLGTSFEKKMASLPAEVFNFSTEEGQTKMLDNFYDNTRWLVFKVKQRGINSLSSKLTENRILLNVPNALGQIQSVTEVQKPGGNQELNYSYNWPYDFFSLIELTKIDLEVENKINSENGEVTGPDGLLDWSLIQGDKVPYELLQQIASDQTLINPPANLDLSGLDPTRLPNFGLIPDEDNNN